MNRQQIFLAAIGTGLALGAPLLCTHGIANMAIGNEGVRIGMPTMLLAGFLIGLQHAVEPDHLAAVASLTTRGRSRSHIIKHGLAWGLGHSITLLIVGGVMLVLNAAVPERVAAGFELVVAVVLILLGYDVLRRLWRDRGEVSVLIQGDICQDDTRSHSHVRPLPLRAIMVGMVHGLAGSAALVLLALNAVSTPLQGFLYILLFGIGSLVGMTTLAALISVPLGRTAGRLIWAKGVVHFLAGAFAIGLGILIAYRIVV